MSSSRISVWDLLVTLARACSFRTESFENRKDNGLGLFSRLAGADFIFIEPVWVSGTTFTIRRSDFMRYLC